MSKARRDFVETSFTIAPVGRLAQIIANDLRHRR
jgi:hypothetical protein